MLLPIAGIIIEEPKLLLSLNLYCICFVNRSNLFSKNSSGQGETKTTLARPRKELGINLGN